jgi:CheY-like chemotaxis protein
LVVEPDEEAFTSLCRRLQGPFSLTHAASLAHGCVLLEQDRFDAIVIRAEEEPALRFIADLRRRAAVPVIAIAAWEAQGDRAAAAGATDWVSFPVNFGHLAEVLIGATRALGVSIESRSAASPYTVTQAPPAPAHPSGRAISAVR